MTVEFGVLIPTREAIMSGRPQTGPLLAMAERAEAAGFDSVWIGDSITARPRHEPLTLMAALAARTRRVRLGTAVLDAARPSRHRGEQRERLVARTRRHRVADPHRIEAGRFRTLGHGQERARLGPVGHDRLARGQKHTELGRHFADLSLGRRVRGRRRGPTGRRRS